MYRKQWHECGECGKKLSSSHSLWRHKKKCQPHRFDGNVGCITTRQKRRADRMYDCLSPQFGKAVSRSPSPPVKKQRTKEDIVGYSDDDEEATFDGVRKADTPAILDSIVNSPRKPPPPPSSSRIISNIPVLPSGIDKLESTTSKGKGLWLSRGRGIDEDDDEKVSKATEKSKKRRKGVAKEHCGKPKKKAIRLLTKLVKELETDDEDTGASDDDEGEKEKTKLEKDRLSLIKSRIRKPKKKLMKLLRDLEEEDDGITEFKNLVKAFLGSEEKEIDQQLQDALNRLETSSKGFEIGMLLREIEKISKDLGYILYRLSDAENLPETVQQLEREGLISKEVAEKLLEKPYTFPEMVAVLKDTKKGAGVTQYVPSSVDEMLDKLALLCGEMSAGNTAVLPQIVALLRRLHQKQQISYNDYKGFCEQLGTCPSY